jgi:hypothetical protein
MVDVVDPAAPLLPNGEVVSATPATAQAVLDSFGQSQGFASAPYPGDVATALPTTLNGALAGHGAPALPAYPFIVQSSHPVTPEAHQAFGPYSLTSKSNADGSNAEAHAGLSTGNASAADVRAAAVARIDRATGARLAQADSVVSGFALTDPVLRIGQITSHGSLTSVPGKPIVKKTSFSIGSMTIAGVVVGFTEQGLQLGPAGALPGLDLSTLNSILEKAGITLTYLPAREGASSIDSAGLAVTFERDVPSQGKVRTSMTLGRVRAAIESTTLPTPELPSSAPGLFTDIPGPSAESGSVSEAQPAPLPGSGRDADAPTLASRASEPAALVGPLPRSAPARTSPAQQAPGGRPARQSRTVPYGSDATAFYLVLVFAGIGALGWSRLSAQMALCLGARSTEPMSSVSLRLPSRR